MYNLLLNWWISAYKEYKTNGTPIGTLPQPTLYKKQEEYKAFNKLLLTSHKTLKENIKLFTETEIGAKFKLAFEDVFTYYGESVRYVYLGKYLKVDDKIKITI